MRGSPQRINESPWARCLQGAVDARWVVVVIVVVGCCGCLFVVVVVVVVVVVCCRRRPGGEGHFGLIVLRHTASLFCHQ